MPDYISYKLLKERLDYNQSSGIFTWKKGIGLRSLGGRRAGTLRKGYILIAIDGYRYPAHRLAWLYVNKEWPKDHLDHIDRNKINNAISNLRVATHSENIRNRIRKDNTSGIPGVTLHKKTGKWHAYIAVNSILHSLGYHRSFEKAKKLRRRAEKKFGVDHASYR